MNFIVSGRTTRPALMAAAITLLVALPAGADTLFTAVLTGSQEVPETPSTAEGLATLILNEAETEVTFHIVYSGLTGVEVGAHFHQAPSGSNGPVVFALPAGSPKDGVWPVGPAEVAALVDHEIYINIHTDAFPGGEIRGNVSFAAVPEELTSWGAIKTLYQ